MDEVTGVLKQEIDERLENLGEVAKAALAGADIPGDAAEVIADAISELGDVLRVGGAGGIDIVVKVGKMLTDVAAKSTGVVTGD